ncbi:MAG: thermonuclease family protein, partial [Acidimicrobiales bacterium]|nr:thermonuclease family protein [Acidimicrobiales bacterium]
MVDGDTVVLRIEGRTERVRLLGVDTPETVHPDRPVECHGPESSAVLHELLPPGTVVTIGRDVQARDPYDRLLLFLTRS